MEDVFQGGERGYRVLAKAWMSVDKWAMGRKGGIFIKDLEENEGFTPAGKTERRLESGPKSSTDQKNGLSLKKDLAVINMNPSSIKSNRTGTE